MHRGQVLRRITAAAAAGRLEPADLAARSQAVQHAGTLGELSEAVADLPGPGEAAVAGPRRRPRRLLAGFLGLAGRWPVRPLASRVVAVAVLGEVVIDLRRTGVTSLGTTITAVALAGEIRIILPPGFCTGPGSTFAVFGRATTAAPPARVSALTPAIRIRSAAILGNVLVTAGPGGAAAPR